MFVWRNNIDNLLVGAGTPFASKVGIQARYFKWHNGNGIYLVLILDTVLLWVRYHGKANINKNIV